MRKCRSVCIETNGFKRIPESVGITKFIYPSGGNDETSLRVRKAKNLLQQQHQQLPRATRGGIRLYFTRGNIDEIYEVMESSLLMTDNDLMFFHPPSAYSGPPSAY